jgi:hypothetical protein
MSGPKHLWSGDWERESEDARGRQDDTEAREPETPQQPPPHRRSKALPLIVIGAVALITGAAFGLSALVHSGNHHGSADTSTAAQAPFPLVPTVPRPQVPTIPTTPQQTTPSPTTPQPTNPTGTTPQATPTPTASSSPIIYWLGMQIETIGPGNVVIDTVRLHTEADQVNLDPGEQIIEINGHQIRSTTDIPEAIKGLHRGAVVPVVVSYGSSNPSTVYLPLGAPPRSHP